MDFDILNPISLHYFYKSSFFLSFSLILFISILQVSKWSARICCFCSCSCLAHTQYTTPWITNSLSLMIGLNEGHVHYSFTQIVLLFLRMNDQKRVKFDLMFLLVLRFNFLPQLNLLNFFSNFSINIWIHTRTYTPIQNWFLMHLKTIIRKMSERVDSALILTSGKMIDGMDRLFLFTALCHQLRWWSRIVDHNLTH